MKRMTPLLAVVAAATLLASPASADCPKLGCEGRLVNLNSGGYLVQGVAVVPVDNLVDYKTCPTPDAWYLLKDDQVIQKIPAAWVRRDYLCCCPSDWTSEVAEVVNLPLVPNERIVLALGEERVCTVELTALEPPAPGSPCDAGSPTNMPNTARGR